MDKKQQHEALIYFKEHALNWAKKGKISPKKGVNVIKQRNDFVIKVIEDRKKTDLVLDIGCGTGDLVCELAAKGIKAIGVDFAKEMIDIAKRKAKRPEYKRASFICCSIFDFKFEPNKYDVISANGFIEYISYSQLHELLTLAKKSLKRGGSLVLGSRNRLFNICSLNKFTLEEIEDNAMKGLMLEAIQISGLENIDDLTKVKTLPLQKEDKKHKGTGIKVSTRYQFTPAQLSNILRNIGFKPVEIYPIHVHGVSPKFKDKYPVLHANVSNLLQDYANNTSLIPQASSFMIHSIKR
jgi:2-polyprenyl-3-methyl-5-hydroxy-6-metoxy-1,4-benzoquinol methylase